MKQIIEGKVYNTETAEHLANASSNESPFDFGYWDEDLYRTKNGTFFIAGEGGAMTRWSKSCGNNSTCGGSGIIPLNESEAREWIERHANEKYEAIFGVAEKA